MTNTTDVVIKHVPPLRVGQVSGIAESLTSEDISPVICGLFDSLMRDAAAAGLAMTGPAIACYAYSDDERIVVSASAQVSDTAPAAAGDVAVVELPEMRRAATLLHHGSMDACQPSYDALERWIADQGLRTVGLPREISLNCPPGDYDAWVTELQLEVADAA